jgi:hypothetical protein
MDNRFDEHLLSTTEDLAAPLITGTTDSLRFLGWASLVLSLLWVWGFGALLGFGVGLIGVLARNRVTVSPPPGLRLCYAGMVLGLVGIGVAVALYV